MQKIPMDNFATSFFDFIRWSVGFVTYSASGSMILCWCCGRAWYMIFLPSIGFLCGERRSSIQTDLVIRFHAAAQRKIISNPLHLRVAFLFLTATLHSKLEILTTWESQKVKLGQINYCRINGINVFNENSNTFRNWDVFFTISIFLIALWRTHTPSKTELSNFQNQPCDIPSS